MEKVLRSKLHEYFDLDTLVDLSLLSKDTRKLTTELKKEALLDVFKRHGVNNIDTSVGTGTNRIAVRIDEYVLKVATDREGCIDNLKEFQMCPRLVPYVTMTYEVSENGSLLLAEYARVFQSPDEMSRYYGEIANILEILASQYLIGDVGLNKRNYGNWGLRRGTNEPVCLDYGYIYDVSSDIIKCVECGSPLFPTKDYMDLECHNPDCKKKGVRYEFSKLRTRLGSTFAKHKIDHLDEKAYVMEVPEQMTVLDEIRSPYLRHKKVKKEEQREEQEEMEHIIRKVDAIFTTPGESEVVATTAPGLIQFRPVDNSGVVVTTKPIVKCTCQPSAPQTVNTVVNAPEGITVAPKEDVVVTPALQQPVEVPPEDVHVAPPQQHTSPVVNVSPVDEAAPKEVQPAVEATPVMEQEDEQCGDDDLAFSSDMDVSDYHELTEEDINQDPSEWEGFNPLSIQLNDEFIRPEYNYLYDSLSRLANYIGRDFQKDDGFQMISPYLRGRFDSEQVYRSISTAVFKSLTEFMKFTVQNDGAKDRYTQPDISDIIEDRLSTLMFLQHFWENHYSVVDDSLGIQIGWIQNFHDRILEKLPLDKNGMELLEEWMTQNWVAEDEITIHTGEEEDADPGPDEADKGPRMIIRQAHHADYDELSIVSYSEQDTSTVPFYIDINSVDPGFKDGPNHEYEWLANFIPFQYVKTLDHDQVNKRMETSNGSIVKSIEYGKVGDFWIGGVYVIDTFVRVDFTGDREYGEDYSNDREATSRLNALVDGTLRNTDISARDLNVKMASMITDPTTDKPTYYDTINALRAGAVNDTHRCSCGHEHHIPVTKGAPEPQQEPDPEPEPEQVTDQVPVHNSCDIASHQSGGDDTIPVRKYKKRR